MSDQEVEEVATLPGRLSIVVHESTPLYLDLAFNPSEGTKAVTYTFATGDKT